MIDLTAIRARADKATPGPWTREECGNDTRICGGDEVLFDNEWGSATGQDWLDAAFIAAARTDVPALCDEVESLRAELAELRRAQATKVTESSSMRPL